MMRLRIYSVALEVVRGVAEVGVRLQRRDPDLARQLRRANSSIALNIAEGVHARGGNQVARFYDAMGSARETVACIEVGVAAGYLVNDDHVELLDRLDHVVATLWKLTHR